MCYPPVSITDWRFFIVKTELVFILDRSGSMTGLESDTIGGYNAMIERQKKEPGEALVTTVLFDDEYELLHERRDIREIRPITAADYYVRGCTALLDAIGRTVSRVIAAQEGDADESRPEKVLFVITTDGLENASREYDSARVKRLVERVQSERGWEFIFLGANMDAIKVAGSMGISADRAATYSADPEGTRRNYAAVCAEASRIRANAAPRASWKADIEGYAKSRRGREK